MTIALASDVQTVTDIVVEQLLATGFLVLIIAIHGSCLMWTSQRFAARFAVMNASTPWWRVMWLMSMTITLLVSFHLFETFLWTCAIYGVGALNGFRTAYLYTLEGYTTLGETNTVLPEKFKAIGPMIAISGLFTFGWTGSSLVYVMSQILKLQAIRTKRAERAASLEKVEGPFGN
ncbi:MAG: two pore domain potassium channel family protein [Hyphomicrobiales bacterium]